VTKIVKQLWACAPEVAAVALDAAGAKALQVALREAQVGWRAIQKAEQRLAKRPSSLVRLASLNDIKSAFKIHG
jgi:hypothetical protein